MIDLFNIDNEAELINEQNTLKKYFYDRYQSSIPVDNKLQLKWINVYQSYSTYQGFQGDERKEERARVNELYSRYSRVLDTNPNELQKRFPREAWQFIFELAMAEFLSRNRDIKLIEKATPPDLVFSHKNTHYFLECTTAASSMMNQYDQLLPRFDCFFRIAQFFHNQSLTKPWYLNIMEIWKDFLFRKKTEFQEVLIGNDGAVVNVNEFQEWFFLNSYACLYFKKVILDEILQMLESICFPMNMVLNQFLDMNFVISRIARKIVDKLKNSYFEEKKGIIAISFSMLAPGIFTTGELTSSISSGDFFYHRNQPSLNMLNPVLNELIKKETTEEQEKILAAFKNLYAILIDTTWYNWFPDVVRNKYGANFHYFDNYYAVVYNPALQVEGAPNYLFNGMTTYQMADVPFLDKLW